MRTNRARSIGAGLALLTLTLSVGCTRADDSSDDGDARSVTFLGAWSGAEQDSFLAMVRPWEKATGIDVEYTGTRDLNAQLTSGVASGNLPDVAGLAGPGPMQDLYEQRALRPLTSVDEKAYAATTPPGFAQLGRARDGTLVGVFIRAAVKGSIWYDPDHWHGGTPATFDDLMRRARAQATGSTKPWCVGLESGAASGWPGTDWIEDIVLRQSGPDAYDDWVAGRLSWTSPQMRRAWQTFGDVLDASYGGKDYVVGTNFGKAANPMFTDPAGCLLHHQASFITDFFKNEADASPSDYDSFSFPDIDPRYSGSVIGSGDLVGVFSDNPRAQSLVRYLLTPRAQQIWVERGGSISGNHDVPASAYPDQTSRRAARVLQSAKTFRFDASDQFPAELNEAFFKGLMSYAGDHGKLDSILRRLDQVRQDAYADD